MSLDCSKKTILLNESEKLYATVYPSNALIKDVAWSSSNWGILDVKQNGLITGYDTGTATITAKTVDGNYSATCVVTVEARESVTVKRDGNFNKIVFHHSGKQWLCVNYDLVNDPDNLSDNPSDNTLDILRDRLYTNTYETVTHWGNNMVHVEGPKAYTDNEQRLLYLLDPNGFAAYVQEYAKYVYNDVTDVVNYKDTLQYDAGQKDFLQSMLQEVGAEVEADHDDGDLLDTRMNMTQLAFIKR